MMSKFFITLSFFFISCNSFSQRVTQKPMNILSNNKAQIYDIEINNVVKVKSITKDSVELYEKKYLAEKYKIICKYKIPTKFISQQKQKRYKNTILTYDIYVYQDSSYFIRDILIKDVHKYLKNKKGIRIKNIYIKDNRFLLNISNKSNNYKDYLLYWYNDILYKVVFVESKRFFKRDVGGFSNIEVLFKANKGFIDFFDNPKNQGMEAYEKIVNLFNKK